MRAFVCLMLCLATVSVAAPKAPVYTAAGNRAISTASSASNFAYMPILNTLRDKGSDRLLCFHTAGYHDQLLELFNLIVDRLPEKPAAREKALVEKIRAAAWKVKRGALGLASYCGISNSWPPEWRIIGVRPGDRKSFEKMATETDRALDALNRLIQ